LVGRGKVSVDVDGNDEAEEEAETNQLDGKLATQFV
jgi:hypothetical protein